MWSSYKLLVWSNSLIVSVLIYVLKYMAPLSTKYHPWMFPKSFPNSSYLSYCWTYMNKKLSLTCNSFQQSSNRIKSTLVCGVLKTIEWWYNIWYPFAWLNFMTESKVSYGSRKSIVVYKPQPSSLNWLVVNLKSSHQHHCRMNWMEIQSILINVCHQVWNQVVCCR